MKLTEQQRKDIRNCLTEISNSYTRIEAERDLIKDVLNRMQEEFDMNKKLSRKLARIYHKRNIEEEIAAAEELSDTYDQVVGTSTAN